MNPGLPTEAKLHAKLTMNLTRGEIFRHELPGAGGWGPALDRDLDAGRPRPARRAGDDRGAPRATTAWSPHGDPPVIDAAATETLRARLRAERTPLPAVAWEPAA